MSTTRAKKQSFTKEQLDELIAKAKNDGAAEKEAALREEMEQQHFETPNGFQNLFSSPVTDIEESVGDIFDFVEKEFYQKGESIIYYIKREGQFLAEIPHPCSWAELQKQYGGGRYIVQARNESTGEYVKQQSQRIAEVRIKDQQTPQPPPQPQIIHQPPAIDTAKILELFRDMQAMMAAKETRVDREERRSAETTMTSITTLMQTQQANTQQMFMEMQKTNMELFKTMQESTSKSMEKMQESTTKLIDKMNEKMEKQIEAISKGKEKELSTFEIFKMINDAKDEGREQMREMMEMIEAKAEERAAAKDDESSGGMGKLVATVIPFLQNAGIQQQTMLQQQAIAQAQNQRRAPQRPQLVRSEPARNTQSQTQGQRNSGNDQSRSGHQSHYPKAVSYQELKSQLQKRPQPVEVIHPAQNQSHEPEIKATELQEKIATIAIPKIAEVMHETPQKAAVIVMNDLEKAGISQVTVLQNFGFDFLWSVAKMFGIDDTKIAWFKEFYAHLENTAHLDDEESEATGGF